MHGKNHHCAGTFGGHVTRFGLRRSEGGTLECSREQNPEWFRATVGGLGLTGLIEWAELQLKSVANSLIDSETVRYGDLGEFFALSEESVSRYEYAVAWVDTLSLRGLGRGLFMRGNHNADRDLKRRAVPVGPHISVPKGLPFSLLNGTTLNVFNNVFYGVRPSRKAAVVPLGPFFYPLDSIGAYHRIYGPGGMIQWQALVPSRDAAREVLLASAGLGGSFLSVMKVMGGHPSAGLLSFSGSGITIALDFPHSRRVLELLPRPDDIVAADRGRLYPAKDARMSGEHFRRYFPQWHELVPFIDPRFSSSFWRRVTAL